DHDRVVSADPRRPGQRHDQVGQGPRRLRQGQSRQVQLRYLLAGLHHHHRAVQAEDRNAGVAVPYKSSNEMMLSVAGGNTLCSIADGPPTMPLVQGGKIRALAVTGSERSSELPDVPSMAEAGYPEVNIGLWSGLFVSVSTPPAIAHKLDTEL